ncbi:MAG TPA: LacI family DNA-binding transcriptional regulator [Actinomycetes bacterium]|nr:LacI family DNA-binding transcriptional regulator [Actinomycetes bacterium]
MTTVSEAGRAPTLEVVAALAGVSRATASRVLTGSPRVSPAAQEAVLRAAEQLHYLPNRAARTLVTRRTDSVAFMVSESGERLFGDPYFGILLRGAHAEVSARGRQLVVTFAADDTERSQVEQFAAGHHVDGLMIVSLHGADPLPARLEGLGIPVVLAGRPYDAASPLHYVDADNLGGSRTATELLLGTGRRRIATIAGPRDMTAAKDRLDGYRKALRGAGLPVDRGLVVVATDFSRPAGAAAMARLLETAPDLDAVFAASDALALGAMGVLRRSGRKVPRDVAVVGFDDTPDAVLAEPPLTTVRQPIVELGRRTAKMLLDRLDGLDVAPYDVVETTLVRRESA